jgi:hypothetical protein
MDWNEIVAKITPYIVKIENAVLFFSEPDYTALYASPSRSPC